MAKESKSSGNSLQSVVDALWKSPSDKEWTTFEKGLEKSAAKYYKVFFPDGLKGKGALTSSYAMVYDSKYRPLCKVPVVTKNGKKLEGATIYLKNLELDRRDQ
jgi:hypothetical protein